jgi:hypothetical protein
VIPDVRSTTHRFGGWGTTAPTVGIDGEINYMLLFNRVINQDEAINLTTLGSDLGGKYINSTGSFVSLNISKILPKKLRITSDSFGLDVNPKLFQFINQSNSDTDTLVIDDYTTNSVDFTLPNNLDTNKQYLLNAHFGSLMTTKRFKYILKDNIMKLLWR